MGNHTQALLPFEGPISAGHLVYGGKYYPIVIDDWLALIFLPTHSIPASDSYMYQGLYCHGYHCFLLLLLDAENLLLLPKALCYRNR